MSWTKPDFQEITLNMEVTAYVNTERDIRKPQQTATTTEVNSPSTTDRSPGPHCQV
jgi:coenzyme PQQ precursor peptide PqqA